MILEELKIKLKVYRVILGWAQSRREIGFVCAGKNKTITHVYRLKNIDETARVAFVPCSAQQRSIRNAIKTHGMAVICEGHSHPHPKDTPKPSRGDCEFIKPNSLEVIVCSEKNEMRCWRMNRSRTKTLTQEVPMKVIR